jgi:SEC-C motif
MGKIGRNDVCSCGSGKKYKKCCELNNINPYTIGETEISDKLKPVMEYLHQLNPNLTYINITNHLTIQSYREYQLKNMNTNIVMIAEKTQHNQIVFFDKEESSDTDVLLMYHGGYRSIHSSKYALYNLTTFLK